MEKIIAAVCAVIMATVGFGSGQSASAGMFGIEANADGGVEFSRYVTAENNDGGEAIYREIEANAADNGGGEGEVPDGSTAESKKKDFIKWVDFRVPCEVMKKACRLDGQAHASEKSGFKFIEALAYLACKNGNDFEVKRDCKRLDELAAATADGKSIPEVLGANKYYAYYLGCYEAVFGGVFGQRADGGYGFNGYFPLAEGYWFNHYDDFGNARTYGFKRRHLGHDIMGGVGTPIIAVEGGEVVECGWNRYGGWRVGIRSHDKKRYYYYAHLRKDKPFFEGIEKGVTVAAGQPIGYLGVTGYSTKENVNMKTKPHLHIGLQLIFDESQADGNGEIWIDLYSLTKFWYACGQKTRV